MLETIRKCILHAETRPKWNDSNHSTDSNWKVQEQTSNNISASPISGFFLIFPSIFFRPIFHDKLITKLLSMCRADLIWAWPMAEWPNMAGTGARPVRENFQLSPFSLRVDGWLFLCWKSEHWNSEEKKTGIVHSGLEIKEPLTELQLETEMASRNLDSVKPTLSWSWTRSVTSHQGPFI